MHTRRSTLLTALVQLTLDISENQLNTSTIDYQNELVVVWSERVKTDTSGILEKTTTHSWGCICCTPDPEYLKTQKKYRYPRKKKQFAMEAIA